MPELHPREQLCRIIECYGVVITNDKKLCKNLLNDLTPEHRLEIHVLIDALEQGMVEQLLKPSSLQIALQLGRLAQSLRDITGIELDLSYWAIESWALALNIITEPIPKPQVPIEPFSFDDELLEPTVKKSKFKVIFFTTCLLALLAFGGLALKHKPKKPIEPSVTEPVLQLEKPAAQIENLPIPSNIKHAEDAWTQNNLGDMYFYGFRVQLDYKTAAGWYQKAAEQGSATGQCNLGYMYAQGFGVARDYQQAAYWYQKAADQGNPDGQNNLGIMYEYGYGVPKDKQQAIFWYSKAVEQGHYGAQQRLSKLVK